MIEYKERVMVTCMMSIKIPETKVKACPLLSENACLAKTSGNERGCDLYTHSVVTCKVLRKLQTQYGGIVRRHLLVPAAECIAAFHDIGKMTPAFQQKIYTALDLSGTLPWHHCIKETEGHAKNSAIILDALYGEKHLIPKLAGAHHGLFSVLQVGDSIEKEELGGKEWQEQRIRFLNRLKEDLVLPDELEIAEDLKEVVLGAVILSDWLSSSIPLSYGSAVSEGAIERALINAGFEERRTYKNLTFEKIFPFAPNDLQQKMLKYIVPGGIYVVESGMGSGKTEAALGLAYKLISEQKADGLYFALPTQMTSEKIYTRLNCFLEQILDESDPGMKNAILIHGDAHLQWDLYEPSGDHLSQKGKDSWFQNKKRALLAPFGAGTIDQALLSVINVKHSALRAFALAGKVVIFDEIHSYDSYTETLLEQLIQRLRSWGCTVILLSATLTEKACRKLGCIPDDYQFHSAAYPRIVLNDHDRISEIAVKPELSKKVNIRHETDVRKVLFEALRRAKGGEQVLWIENTVEKVQEIFRLFSQCASGIEIGIIHSRYPVKERNRREGYWTEVLGKNGAEKRRECGRILIASQVLEQSVDVDADFLVTRMAPADFIFQRLGRLWRHQTNDRAPGTVCSAVLLESEELFEPEKLSNGKNGQIYLPYSPYWLCRTAEILKDKTDLVLPDDIRGILERVYMDREENGAMQILKSDIVRLEERLINLANAATAECGSLPDNDDQLATRYSEQPQVQVLLLKKGNCGENLKEKVCSIFEDEPILLDRTSRSSQLETSKKLLANIVKVSAGIAPAYETFNTDFLQDFLWIGDHEFRPVRIAYVNGDGELLDSACNPLKHSKGTLFYHKNTGYEIRKEKN